MDDFKKRKFEEATNNNNDEITTNTSDEEEKLQSLLDPLAKTQIVDRLSKLDLGSVQQQQQPWQLGITILASDIVNHQEQEDQQLQQQMISYRQETPSCNKMILQQIGSYDGSYKLVLRCDNPSERDELRKLKRKLLDESDVSGHIATPPSGQVLVNGTNPGNVVPRKTRIRWTKDLHDRFVQCLTCLGGAEKATPNAILRLMDSEGLTIFHVKSHLQKYRAAKYLHENAKGNLEKRTGIDTISQIDNITGLQFKETLQMRLFEQRQLHEQLEIQRNLQLRIEEQAKQLKMMFDQHRHWQQKASKSQNSEITSLHDDRHSTNLDDEEIVNLEDDDENTLFPSKIS